MRQEPWWLLTDRPVETAEQVAEVFRMYCQRWAIEDVFKTGKTCLGWEDVQVLAYDAVRLLVALGWVAAGFLFDLGVTLEWGEVRRLLDYLAMEAILAEEERRHGGLPPRIAAMLGRPPTSA